MKRTPLVLFLLATLLLSVLLFSSCGKTEGRATSNEPATDHESDLTNNLFFDGLAVALRNHKFGYIDKTGKEVIPCKYNSAAYAFSNGVTSVQEKSDGPWYYIKTDGTRLLETPFFEASDFDDQGRAFVKKSENAKEQMIDKSGKTFFTAKNIESGKNGLYLFQDDFEMWGVVDKDGEVLLSARYDQLDFSLSDRLIARRKSAESEIYYLIDLNGNELYRAKKGYTIDSTSVDGTFIIRSERKNEEDYLTALTLVDRTGKEIATVEGKMRSFDYSAAGMLVEFYENEDGKDFSYRKMIDWSGNVLHDFRDGDYDAENLWENEIKIRIRGASDGCYGVMDAKTGEILIPAEYGYLSGFDSNGYVIGQKKEDEDFAVLDRTGRTVFTVSCDRFYPFGTSTKTPYYVAEYNLGSNTSYELLDKEGNVVYTFGITMEPYEYYDDGYIVYSEYIDENNGGYGVLDSSFQPICPTIYRGFGPLMYLYYLFGLIN